MSSLHKGTSTSCFFVSSRRRHTMCLSDWSSDVCSSDLVTLQDVGSTASAPTAIVTVAPTSGKSVIGVQFVPPLVVIQRPPSAPLRYTLLALLGFTTSAVTRPEVNGAKKVVLVACGPIGNHDEVGPRGGARKPGSLGAANRLTRPSR